MIGNDIVDLRCAAIQSNWKRIGYLNKIYTSVEQDLINSATHPELMVWILWTMKEASYKANNRITHIREYAPVKIKCKINHFMENTYYGTVQYGERAYNVKTSIFDEYVHTVALYESSSFSLLKKLIVKNYPLEYGTYLKQNNYLAPSEMIKKDEHGIPNIISSASGKIEPISISHHGIFLSVVSIKE